jgi:glutaredoxin
MAAKDSPLPEVVLYTRVGCHLCDEAKEQIRRAKAETPFAFREVDIDLDPELRQRYNEEVPVVFVGGKKAFQHRIDLRQFRKQLRPRRG